MSPPARHRLVRITSTSGGGVATCSCGHEETAASTSSAVIAHARHVRGPAARPRPPTPAGGSERCGHCGHEPRGSEELWRCDGCGRRVCATPSNRRGPVSCIGQHWHDLAVHGRCPEPTT